MPDDTGGQSVYVPPCECYDCVRQKSAMCGQVIDAYMCMQSAWDRLFDLKFNIVGALYRVVPPLADNTPCGQSLADLALAVANALDDVDAIGGPWTLIDAIRAVDCCATGWADVLDGLQVQVEAYVALAGSKVYLADTLKTGIESWLNTCLPPGVTRPEYDEEVW